MINQNILQTIGNTPMVKINKLNTKPGKVHIFAKLEGVNPGGSIKDRVALKMIEAAVASKELTASETIIEATSGNTGISLAMIGAVKGYRVEIVMSEAVSIERQKMIKAFGAKIILTPKEQGTDGAITKVRELVVANPKKYYHTDQFSNDANRAAHYETTAQEIWQQTNGEIDYFVAAIGTSGTLMGVGEYLKKYNPRVKIVSAEPEKGHYIQGLKNMEEAIVPALYDKSRLDDIIMINTEEAYEMARQIPKKEGIFVGMSSGAAMLASLKVAEKIIKGNIVTIFPDRGEKYLSTDLFS
ncbi:cysteine synthase family protein [Candidatus Parcubacteria bacterium]|nr:cysteine synthase family protein [Candidatus Parcubacteria bacterium]